MISYGFDPYLSEDSPYIGAINAVVESMSKLIAAGGNLETLKLTFQEYYEKLNDDPIK
jgi:phosphoribosylformylglycinamidine synthase